MKCFYHHDLDGQASGFIIYNCVHVKDVHCPVEMIKINYGTSFPLSRILPNEQVWIVDYSIEPDEMRKLLQITSNVVWIDHHETAIKKYADFDQEIKGVRRIGEAACVLTWKYVNWWSGGGLYQDFTRDFPEEKPIPRCILLTGDRDVWDWKYGDETKNFFSGSQLYDTSPDSDFWLKCICHEVETVLGMNPNTDVQKRGTFFWRNLLAQGKLIEKFKLRFYSNLAHDIGYVVKFEGHLCFAVNAARVSSDLFNMYLDEFDILIPYYHNGKEFVVSLYSKNIRVSDLAVKHGGGGHDYASGFSCKELPFILG